MGSLTPAPPRDLPCGSRGNASIMQRSSQRNPPLRTSPQPSQPASGEPIAETSAVHLLDEPEVDPVLNRLHANFRAVLELSSEFAMVHRHGRIVFANAALVRALGLGTRDDLIGTPVVDLYDDENLEVVEARVLAPRRRPGGRRRGRGAAGGARGRGGGRGGRGAAPPGCGGGPPFIVLARD